MRTTVQARVMVSVAGVVGGFALLASCATTAPPRPQQLRFFLPPKPPAPEPAPPEPLAPPPEVGLYANELPSTVAALPVLTRPNDPELLIRQAEDRFASGKRAYLEGRPADARRDFNRAIQLLLAAPDNVTDHSRLERRLEEIADAIYRYDLDQLAPAGADSQAEFEKRPLDELVELTFPIDPSLRGKVKQEIARQGTSEFPLEESDSVISYINFFTSPRGKRVLEGGLKRSGRYKAMIERVLEEEGLPKELIFLAQAESGFFPRAISIAKCVGLWQFAAFRGKEYGLNQSVYADDRMDPEKATHAAARHLKDLYNHFGDWYLAMAAYDCGPGCVDNAVARTGYADFWALKRLGVLPKETANYVPVILAMTIVGKNAADYGLNVEFDAPVDYESVELKSATHLALAATALDMPISELRELNPALLRSTAPSGYVLRVPRGTAPQLEAAFDVVPEAQRDSWRVHRVESGDTLGSLAKRYGAAASAVNAANSGELPEVGLWAAIPVAYPGDRVVKGPVKPVAKPAGKPAVKATAGAVKAAARPAVGRTSPPVAHKTPAPAKAPVRRSGA